jgi:hypothetical protein
VTKALLICAQMKKSLLARKVARKHSIEPGAAADQMDRVVNQIIRALRRGEEAHLPGLGTLVPGKDWALQPEQGKRRPDER